MAVLWRYIYLLILLYCSGFVFTQSDDSAAGSTDISKEASLIKYLENKYEETGKIARPKKNSALPIEVKFALRLIQMDIDEKSQTMKTSVWAFTEWYDDNLKWNPDKYGGIERITLPRTSVWVPDVSLVNTAETKENQRDSDVMVLFKGQVQWIPHRTYISACLLDITNYPYDEHTCSMWFQSMAHYNETLRITVHPKQWDMDTYLSSFKESQEWQIINNSTMRIEIPKQEGMMVKFSQRPALKFTLVVRRRIGYTGHLLMLPCVFLAVMSIIVFCLPPERPDRNTLAMSLFASFTVLLLILVEVVPPTAASVPKLGVYYAFNMTLVMLSVFLSTLVIRVSRLGDYHVPVPKILKVIFIDVIARPLLMHKFVCRPFLSNIKNKQDMNQTTHSSFPNFQQEEAGLKEEDGNLSQLGHVILRIDERLKRVEQVVSRPPGEGNDPELKQIRLQWVNLSKVLDRMFIVLYIIAIVISLIVLFPRRH